MTYVPRSPRRATRLRAVVDDGAHHTVGLVRDMSTSGMFVEGASVLSVGCRVAVVPLIGELDGERLLGEVTRVAERGVAVRFLGLDSDLRQRLRRTFAGDEPTLVTRRSSLVRSELPSIPQNAPVFLLTETEEPAVVIDPVVVAPHVIPMATLVASKIERLEGELRAITSKHQTVLDENARLKKETMAQQARLSVALSLRLRVDDDLADARAAVEDLERGEDALIHRIQTLERLLRMAMNAPGDGAVPAFA